MTDFKELVRQRRSHRQYDGREIDSEALRLIMRAALMSPTSKGQRAWQFVVVDDKEKISKLADTKDAGSQLLRTAPVAIVVLGDDSRNDCWVEDGSIAAITMQYQAAELGLGTCWVQLRGRALSDGTSSEDIVRGIIGAPSCWRVLCVVAVGYASDVRQPQNEDKLRWENVHVNTF